MRILDHQKFDLKEFSARWQQSRLSALRSVLGDAPSSSASDSEEDLIKSICPDNRELALRKVFDYSRQFGMSASRYLGMTFEISDLAEVLRALPIPCFRGDWRSHNGAYVFERNGCEALERVGAVGCDYWREALDGLVVGVGEDERLARHRSRGHGDAECVDVLFVEKYTTPRIIESGSADCASGSTKNKYGPVSAEVAQVLEPVRKRFQNMKIQLVLEGESEGTLYYRLDADEGVLCGAGGKLLHDSFQRDVSNLCPKHTVRDASPLAVYGGAT